MNIFAFIDQYCQDIIEKVKADKRLVDLSGFPCDEVIVDGKGKSIPVVYVDGVPIPIKDFFSMTKADFLNDYKLPSANEAYDNYLDNFTILEGEAVLSQLRISLQAEMERLHEDLVDTGVALNIG